MQVEMLLIAAPSMLTVFLQQAKCQWWINGINCQFWRKIFTWDRLKVTASWKPKFEYEGIACPDYGLRSYFSILMLIFSVIPGKRDIKSNLRWRNKMRRENKKPKI